MFNENKIIETENQYAEDKEFENIKETEFVRIAYVNVVPEGSMRPVILKTMSTPIFPKKEVIYLWNFQVQVHFLTKRGFLVVEVVNNK